MPLDDASHPRSRVTACGLRYALFVGSRSNFVLYDDAGADVRYEKWGAGAIDHLLVRGCDATIAHLQTLEHGRLLDDVWADGGVLVDPPRQALLFFGGECTGGDVLAHRVMLALIASIWRGWDVRWAYEGLATFADHLEMPRSAVLSERTVRPHAALRIGAEDQATGVLSAGGLHYLLDVERAALFDSSAPTSLPLAHGRPTLSVPLGQEDTITFGLHLDLHERRIDLWDADARWGEPIWDGWTVVHHHDRFEHHRALSNGTLVFDTPPQASVVDRVVTYFADPGTTLERDLRDALSACGPLW